MDKLVALPVSGDSFLLRREKKNILVDGGKSTRRLIKALSSPSVAVNHLHVVVCTHADDDHAGGLTDLLDKGLVQVDEFWLPGAWSDILPELLKNPKQVVDGLMEELSKFDPNEYDLDLSDEDNFESGIHAWVAKQRREIQNPRDSKFQEVSNPLDIEAGLKWLKEQASLELNVANDAKLAKAFNRGRISVRYHVSKMKLDWKWRAFWVSLINTAERIRKIAVQAIRHNVKVRWFDFEEFFNSRHACGGDSVLLVPLNSVELEVPRPPIGGLSYVARLTPINEECLVFMSPSTDHCPHRLGVVFTGDSPLGYGSGYANTWLNKPEKPCLVVATAPHHGSESNAMAYGHLTKIAHVVLWVRSGGTSKHPGPTFRNLSRTMRACTHCHSQRYKSDVAEVQLSGFCPFFRVRAHDCNC